MEATAAARLAASLRTVKKDQSLSGPVIAERIERLTGTRPTDVWVSRRIGGRKRLITVDPDLFVIARALEVDRDALIAIVIGALFGYAGDGGERYEIRPEQAHKHVPEEVTDELVG